MSQETIEKSPVLATSESSWRCLQSGDREVWLALMAEAVTNPDGTGVRGKDALAAFCDAKFGQGDAG